MARKLTAPSTYLVFGTMFSAVILLYLKSFRLDSSMATVGRRVVAPNCIDAHINSSVYLPLDCVVLTCVESVDARSLSDLNAQIHLVICRR